MLYVITMPFWTRVHKLTDCECPIMRFFLISYAWTNSHWTLTGYTPRSLSFYGLSEFSYANFLQACFIWECIRWHFSLLHYPLIGMTKSWMNKLFIGIFITIFKLLFNFLHIFKIYYFIFTSDVKESDDQCRSCQELSSAKIFLWATF